jgi:ribosome-binding protein aMBF1 (putative translation factor)
MKMKKAKMKKKIKLIPFENIKRDLMKRPGFKKAYDDLEFEFSIRRAIIIARGRYGLTQRQLAEKISVPQSSLARFESGRANPTLSFLMKVVGGLGLKITVQ